MIKFNRVFILIIVLILSFQIFLFAEENQLQKKQNEILTFSQIVEYIQNYKNKEVIIVLRLKYVDNIFYRVVFYDENNHDIEFDISEKIKNIKFKNEMKNLHRGMKYKVKFNIRGVGNLNYILADLLSFESIVLEKLP